MDFNIKLQELRKKKGLTQEELAGHLYVSRTAISKWESGRGYPNIESLKEIASFFSVTVDELLSTNEILTIAEVNKSKNENHLRDLVYGLLDISIVMLFFLPLFASRVGNGINSTSLLALEGIQPYVKAVYFVVIAFISLFGIITLAMKGCRAYAWLKSKSVISLSLGALAVFLFIISSQPYPAVFALFLLIIKGAILIKRK